MEVGVTNFVWYLGAAVRAPEPGTDAGKIIGVAIFNELIQRDFEDEVIDPITLVARIRWPRSWGSDNGSRGSRGSRDRRRDAGVRSRNIP